MSHSAKTSICSKNTCIPFDDKFNYGLKRAGYLTTMRTDIFSKYISKIKGEDYEVDSRIPVSYLLGIGLNHIIMKARGWLCNIKGKGVPFIGHGVRIKAKSKITLGNGVLIRHHCYIDALSTNGVELGDDVSMGPRTKIECTGSLKHIGKGLKVGNHVGLGADNFYGCAGGITIGNDTLVGNFVSFHSENHVFDDIRKPIRLQGVTHKGITIGNDCWIGAKATILDGAIISDGCIIAAGAVVGAGVYEEKGIYGGVPAKFIKFRD